MRREAPTHDRSGFVDVVVRPGGGRPRGGVRTRPRLKRRPSGRGPSWRKTLFPLLVWGAVIFCSVGILCRAARPFMLYDREEGAASQLRQQLEDCRRENEMLERRIKYLGTPQGRAQAARELGWVKPGEITVVIPPDNQPQPKK